MASKNPIDAAATQDIKTEKKKNDFYVSVQELDVPLDLIIFNLARRKFSSEYSTVKSSTVNGTEHTIALNTVNWTKHPSLH